MRCRIERSAKAAKVRSIVPKAPKSTKLTRCVGPHAPAPGVELAAIVAEVPDVRGAVRVGYDGGGVEVEPHHEVALRADHALLYCEE